MVEFMNHVYCAKVGHMRFLETCQPRTRWPKRMALSLMSLHSGLETKRIPSFLPAIAIFAAVTFAAFPLLAQVNDTADADQTFALALYNNLKTREVKNLAELAGDFQYQQTLWLSVAPPTAEFMGWTQDADTTPLPFDPASFPANFIAGLVPASVNGVVVYPITACEDPITSQFVFYNSEGQEIGTVPTPTGYDSRWCLFAMYPDLETRGWAAEYINSLTQIYEPSHLAIRYNLVKDEDLGKLAMNEATEAAVRAEAATFDTGQGGGIMLMRTPAAESNIVIEAMTLVTNGVMLQIGYPNDFTNRLEVFTCTDLVPFWWTLTATNLSTAGTNTIYWTDTDTNAVVRFFAIGNADTNATTDPDSDGLTWAQEKYLYHTSPTNSDTDGDGLSDYQEIIVLNTDPNNNDTNKPVVQISFPTNNYQWVWMP